MSRPTQMLSIRLKEKWQAIMATAGAASRNATGRSGPVVRDPTDGGGAEAMSGGLAAVACYQHERVIVALHVAGDDGVGDLLRAIGERQRLRESILDAVGEENHGVAQGERYRARLGMRRLSADESRVRHEGDARGTITEIGAQQDTADVADTQPRHRRSLRIEVREPEDDTAQSDQRFLAVTQPVDDRDERSLPHTFDETQVARFRLPRQRQRGERRVDFQMARRHLAMVIVVPRPTTESTSNSSMSRLAPGSPAPTPWDVE